MYKRLKKDSKWSILEIDNFKIDGLKKEIEEFKDEWFIDTSRQKKLSVHANTQFFRICATDYDWVPGTPVETLHVNSFKSSNANKEINHIFKKLEDYYSGKIVRCEVVKMNANSEIYKHVDGGAMLHYSRRIHVPIITKPEITFTVMNNTIHMKEGIAYEINNQMQHAVKNPTDLERVHIIIDVLPDDMINYTQIGD